MCAPLQGHTVPVIAHWQQAQHWDEAGRRERDIQDRAENQSDRTVTQ